jgi:hypothetical protein
MKRIDVKSLLSNIPFSADLYWHLRQDSKPPVGGYSLDQLNESLPLWVAQIREAKIKPRAGKRVFVFTMLRYWLEQTVITSLALSALGHDVTLAYLPYAHWKYNINRFDLRRQNLYIQDVLKSMEEFVNTISVVTMQKTTSLPAELTEHLAVAAYRDVQYSLLREDVDRDSDLYRLRMERNRSHTQAMFTYMKSYRPDVVIVPNGSMLEFGITYKTAEYLGIPVVTYEFGEQSERIWLAQNDDVMRQDTSMLWNARVDAALTHDEWTRVREFFSARQGGGLWENFSRRWQGTPSQGENKTRADLGLDTRPIILLPANVLGDSLTLGRHIFSESMTEWMIRTIKYFIERDDVQFIIRIHPGEQIGWGPSVFDILTEEYPSLPENIHLLPADAKINTYDLVAIADVGLVFTTTVGMEMAMVGLPVIVSGETHYREKGFTLDANSWDSYLKTLDEVLMNPKEYRLSREQVDAAWTYAYRFFFEYPQPFPWHVQHFWEDEKRWPLSKVLTADGDRLFGKTFDYLVGEPIVW